MAGYLSAPRKTPDEIAQVLEQTMEKISKDPGFYIDMKKYMRFRAMLKPKNLNYLKKWNN